MLREVVSQEQLGSGLDVGRGQSSLVVVSDQFAGLEGELLEKIGHEGVDNLHSLLRDSDIVRDGLEDLVDIQRERGELLLVASNLFGLGHTYYKISDLYLY